MSISTAMKEWLARNWPVVLLLLVGIGIAGYWGRGAQKAKKGNKRLWEENVRLRTQLQEHARRDNVWNRTRGILRVILGAAARWWAWYLTHATVSSLPCGMTAWGFCMVPERT
jgi:hypothetical protein